DGLVIPDRRSDGRLLLKSIDEPAQDTHPDIVLADRILDAVFQAWIVVDFHDNDAVSGLFEVDAVKALTDRPGGAYGNVDHLGGGLIEAEGAETAFMRRAVRSVFHYLPMPARHAVLADEQRLAGKHA